MIAKPLTDLTKKDEPFVWTEKHQEAFEKLKDLLINYPVLAHYDSSRETQLRTDACYYGLGAILLQKIDGKWHPIAYASRLLRGPQLNYHIGDKECLAIVFAVEKWHSYLDGIYFEVMTDHCSLCFLTSKKDLSPRLIRYSLMLQRYNFKIVYKSGKHHHDVDALSRYPIVQTEIDKEDIDRDGEDEFVAAICLGVIEEQNELRQKQQEDPKLKSIIYKMSIMSGLSSRARSRLSKFKIHEGILYRLVRRPFSEEYNIMVPKSMQKEICRAYHDDVMSGHPSAEKTYQRIITKYYWSNMAKYINQYVATCDACQRNKKTYKLAAPLQSIHSSEPFQRIGIDVVGPLPQVAKFKYTGWPRIMYRKVIVHSF